ncbi:uncharacterized protein LOC100369100 [Saccoglossus kowalevskii]|uniref:Uncharacterized protein LOC100369100 n=1 Tax=Saccoglossus kowalevskii TaxID=10224 RepID=A0ABM0GXS3_SACKO|nr:PREDICTED: uncharacterized protein LOC100369100 [Saccoglossus kowalevskii]
MSSLVIVWSVSILIATSSSAKSRVRSDEETKASLVDHSAEEKKVENIVYGGILKDFSRNVQPNDTDIVNAVEYSLEFISLKHADKLPKDDKGNMIRPQVLDPKKLKLQYTMDGVSPFHYDVVTIEGGKKQYQSRQIIVGVTYFFILAWPSVKNSYRHQFIISQDRLRNSYIYEHTYYFPDYLKSAMMDAGSTDEYCKVNQLFKSHMTVSGQPVSDHMTMTEGESLAESQTHVTPVDQSECPHLSKSFPGKEKTGDLLAKFELKNKRIDDHVQYFVSAASYNIWNFNSFVEDNHKEYERRILHLGEIVSQSDSDIVSFQEVRFDLEKSGELGPFQVQHLSLALPNYQFIYQPAMTFMDNIFGRTEEGLAIFSKFPIKSHDFILLSRNASDPNDFHQRICIHAEIEFPVFGMIHVFNTHLSLSEDARDRTVVEIWEFMQKFTGPALLMGDLNAEPHEKSIKFLTGQAEINGVQTKGLYDAWTLQHKEPRSAKLGLYRANEKRDHGLTWSTIKPQLVSRIDYIFVRLPKDIQLHNISLLDDGKRKHFAASDHLGLLATVSRALNIT